MLLTQDKRGMAMAALGQYLEWLVRLIERRRGKLATIWAQQSVDAVVDTALGVMAKLLLKLDGVAGDNVSLDLAKYRNRRATLRTLPNCSATSTRRRT